MNKTIVRSIFFFLFLTCSACMSVPSDPYSQKALAEGYIAATQAAERERASAAAIEAARTAQAAQAEIALLEAKAEATRQAAVAQQLWAESTRQQQIFEATVTAQSVYETSTAVAAASATSAAWPAQATQTQAVVNEVSRQDAQRALEARWHSVIVPVRETLPYLLWLIVLILAVVGMVFAYRRLMPVLEMRMRTVSRGDGIDPLFLFPDLLVDPGRLFGPALSLGNNGQAVQLLGSAPSQEAQAEVTARAQVLRGASILPIRTSRGPSSAVIEAEEVEDRQPQLPRFAPWRMLDTWRVGSLPLGLGTGGLVLADPEINPHMLFAGTTGSGKTRYGLRPLIASALASGWQVVVLDRSGLDFMPFNGHDNSRIVILDNGEDAVGYLASLYGEVARRFSILRDAKVSTWGRLPNAGPRILAVIDEFSNLADSLDRSGRDELWRQARMIAAEGRKSGVHLALALQDPTHQSIDLRIRRNATPVSFRVKDQDASHVVLGAGGAEALQDRQFLTVMSGGLVRGVAFSPSDEEIGDFLDSHHVETLPQPCWLNAGQNAASQPTGVVDRDAEIRTMNAAGSSMSEIQMKVFGYTGGSAYSAVRRVLSATTTA